jgi:hypothetical protein
MKITNRQLMITFEQEVEIGDLTATLTAQVFYNPDTKNMDIDFADIDATKFRGIEIKGFDNWRKFKAFHLEMGIDYSQLLDEKFNEIFTEGAVRNEVTKLKMKF